jgi:anti-sigma regulatory factor (Ser/Thr protein kinase)
MSTMTLTRPTRPPELQSHCARLTAGPAAVPAARHQVQAAIRAWEAPVDPADAALLTSELVTNAVQHAAGLVVTLVIACSGSQVRVDVHDTSRSLPEVTEVPADAESGRGLQLVATLADEWGFYRTPAGKAVYFTLAFGPDPGRVPPGVGGRCMPGDGEP